MPPCVPGGHGGEVDARGAAVAVGPRAHPATNQNRSFLVCLTDSMQLAKPATRLIKRATGAATNIISPTVSRGNDSPRQAATPSDQAPARCSMSTAWQCLRRDGAQALGRDLEGAGGAGGRTGETVAARD